MKKLFFPLIAFVALSNAKKFDYLYYGGDYNEQLGCPSFTHYVLTKNQVHADVAERDGISFWVDESLNTKSTKDYVKSGYDRGHMVPAEDMSFSVKAMHGSFSMANVCPQLKELNRGPWAQLEKAARDSAVSWGANSIWTGPLYRGKTTSFKGITVPTHFFKVLCNHNKCTAYVYPNTKNQMNDMASHIVDLKKLQLETKLNFQ